MQEKYDILKPYVTLMDIMALIRDNVKNVAAVKSDARSGRCAITDGDIRGIKAVSYNGTEFILNKEGGEYQTQNFIGLLKVLEYQKRLHCDTPSAFAEDDARLLTLFRTPLIDIDT